MLRLLKKLRRNERGNVLIILAAAMPLLVGSAGLAVDTIQWALWKRQLQRAADSAALAGVYERVRAGGDTAGVSTAVSNDLAINQKTGMALLEPAVIDTSISDTATMKYQVKVTLKVQKPLTFSSIFMAQAPIIQTSATAAGVKEAGEPCVKSLDKRASIVGIEIAGSTSVDMSKCRLFSNSANNINSATNTGQGSSVKALRIGAVGGIQQSAKWQVDGYDPYSAPIEDSYANLPMPSSPDYPTKCTKTITISDKQQDYPIDRSAQDSAGEIVCVNGGVKIAGNLKLGSATYVINSTQDFTMNSSNSNVGLSCTSCSILLTNFADPTKTGNFQLTGGAINVTAPTDDTNPYKGIAFYQDRRVTDTGGQKQNQINGNAGSVIAGAIYTPHASLSYSGASTLTSAAACIKIIGYRVQFTGNSKIASPEECPGLYSGGATSMRPRLVA